MTTDFVRTYIRGACEFQDSPPIFHQFVALTILSRAVGTNVWFGEGANRYYPNLWLLLLGPSALFRKSTCLRIGAHLVKAALGPAPQDELSEDERYLRESTMPERTSLESLEMWLRDHPSTLITNSEFGAFMKRLDRDYSRGTKEYLSALYDADSTSSFTKKDHLQRVPAEHSISWLAASTLEWLEGSLSELDLRGGFLARFLLLPAREMSPEDWRLPGQWWNPATEAQLVTHLHEVSQISGKVDFAAVDGTYIHWLQPYEQGLRQAGRDRPEIGLLSRAGVTVKKICILYAMSSHRHSLVITEEDLQRAIRTWEQAEARLAELFDELAWTPMQRQIQSVRRVIRGNPGITRSQLLRKSNLLARDLNTVLTTLAQRGEVATEVSGEGREKVQIYSWTGS